MSEFNKELSGTFGRNTYKNSDSQPDFRGNCVIKGEEYKISGWIKEGSNGKFFSLSFTPKEQPKIESFDPAQDYDDSIPF